MTRMLYCRLTPSDRIYHLIRQRRALYAIYYACSLLTSQLYTLFAEAITLSTTFSNDSNFALLSIGLLRSTIGLCISDLARSRQATYSIVVSPKDWLTVAAYPGHF